MPAALLDGFLIVCRCLSLGLLLSGLQGPAFAEAAQEQRGAVREGLHEGPVPHAFSLQNSFAHTSNSFTHSFWQRAQYEKCYRELAQSLAACREHGAKEPNLSSDPSTLSLEDIRSSLSASSATTSARQNKKSRPFSSPFSKRSTSSDSTAPSEDGVSPSQGSKLVHWLLPTDEERKHELTATATQNLLNAELARRACWDAWKEIAEMSHNGAIEYMHALADFQTLEEECINNMQDHLKKMTVFECSAVANQQYDLQMLFKVLESISCSKDLVSFLRAQSTASQEGQAPPAFADMVGRGSCTPFTALPPPPTARRLEGPPFMEDDIPVESTINLEVQLTMPSLYRSSSAHTHEHLQGEEHESDIECNLVPSQEIVETLKKMERKGRSSSSDSKSDCGTPNSAIPTLRLTVSSNQLYPLDEDEASSTPSAEISDSASRVPALQLDEVQAQIVTEEDDDEGDDNQEAPRLAPSDKDTPRLSEHEHENENENERGAEANEQRAPESTTTDDQASEDEQGEVES